MPSPRLNRTLEPDNRSGEDGIDLSGDVCAGWRPTHSFYTWSPDKSRMLRFFQSIAELGLHTIADPEGIARIEDAMSYFYDGLHVRDMGGQPHVFRIYGAFSSDEADEMMQFLA